MTNTDFEVIKALFDLCGETCVKILDKQDIISANPLVPADSIGDAIQSLKSAEFISLKYADSDEYCISLTQKGISALAEEKERLRQEEEARRAAEARRLEEERRKAEEARKRAEELARLEKLRQEEEARRIKLRQEEEARKERERLEAERLAKIQEEKQERARQEQERRQREEAERRERELNELRAIAMKVGIKAESAPLTADAFSPQLAVEEPEELLAKGFSVVRESCVYYGTCQNCKVKN